MVVDSPSAGGTTSRSERLATARLPARLLRAAWVFVVGLTPAGLEAQVPFDRSQTWTATSQVDDACTGVPYSIVGPGGTACASR